MSQELNSYIYLLEEKKGSSHNIISFEPTLSAAQKTLTKLVEREKNTLGVDGAQIYTTKIKYCLINLTQSSRSSRCRIAPARGSSRRLKSGPARPPGSCSGTRTFVVFKIAFTARNWSN